MGDFLLDFRPKSQRHLARAGDFLQFFPDIHVTVLDQEEFGLVLTSPDDPELWGPAFSADGNVFVGLCGRIALDQQQWNAAKTFEERGGLAAKFILRAYREGGIARACDLNGHFVALIFDRRESKFFLITDRWGIAPAFECQRGKESVICSHPDALADALSESRNWDLTSVAEFILTCRLSYPHTYYNRVKSLPFASIITISVGAEGVKRESVRRYFDFAFDPQPESKPEALLEELEAAFRKAVTKRTLPALGRAAVALSGGLDSRALLCCAGGADGVFSFCCHDEENDEFHIARAVAKEAGVPFVPFRRGPDFYADNAVLGTRISAGMGCIASNHFLGFRDELRHREVSNLLTGCYCDYVFKGLGFNKRVNPWTTVESLGDFDFAYYASHNFSDTALSAAVRERLEDRFPPALRALDSEACAAEVEHRRVFPLIYEEDNAARSIPQRVMGWYIPIAENALMAARLKMSSSMKLNRRLFGRLVEHVCGPRITRIPDANTGAPVNASVAREAACSHWRRASNVLRKLTSSRSTSGSWLNWNRYITSSEKIRVLWQRPNPEADDIFRQVLGRESYSRSPGAYGGHRVGLFLQLFTLKLWFDQRVS